MKYLAEGGIDLTKFLGLSNGCASLSKKSLIFRLSIRTRQPSVPFSISVSFEMTIPGAIHVGWTFGGILAMMPSRSSSASSLSADSLSAYGVGLDDVHLYGTILMPFLKRKRKGGPLTFFRIEMLNTILYFSKRSFILERALCSSLSLLKSNLASLI